MYKPPQNCNRVKSMKNKFENIENQKEFSHAIKRQSYTTSLNALNKNNNNNNKKTEPLTEKFKSNQQPQSFIASSSGSSTTTTDEQLLLLSRQNSDPLKRNIKRTPAFRLDKNTEKAEYQISVPKQKTLFESKIKQFNNSVKGGESNKVNCINNHYDSNGFVENNSFLYTKNIVSNHHEKKPLLIKSKSSFDFHYTKNNNKTTESLAKVASIEEVNNINKNATKISMDNLNEKVLFNNNVDLSTLYTEPIPKFLRNKTASASNRESPLFRPKIDNFYSKSTLKLSDGHKKEFLESLKKVISQDLPGGLTDSLRVALKKPLPVGPAPQKPPRTFNHNNNESIQEAVTKNNHSAKKKTLKRSDPKYMLNKLETALKNNNLKVRNKPKKIEVSTTSGEDSDDSLLFRSKSCRMIPSKLPQSLKNSRNVLNGPTETILGDLNCFNSLGCGNSPYAKPKESNAVFFLQKDPIYDEPIQIRHQKNERYSQRNRNSLYYMSTAVVSENTSEISMAQKSSGILHHTNSDGKINDLNLDRPNTLITSQFSAENSSLSSFASDAEMTPSPTDDSHTKIRYLIDNFEQKKQTLSKKESHCENSSTDSISRVELLKNSLKDALDKSFGADNNNHHRTSNDSDVDKTEDGKVSRMVERFHTFQKSAPKYQQPKIHKDTLFYCCLVIEKVQDCAQIKFKFPPDVEIPHVIEQLCFPESVDALPLEGSNAAQTYSLLVTNETGDRTYGYCRRVLPEASTYCLPLAYCILSKYRSANFYKKILLELESRHGMPDRLRNQLISEFYYKKFPKPGESITINLSYMQENGINGIEDPSLDLTSYIDVKKCNEYASNLSSSERSTVFFLSENDILDKCMHPSYVAYEGNRTELILTLNPDTRYEDADLKKLHKLPSDILLKIFSSLLLERKVILISSAISDLSACVDSLQSILYPFTWYHTFIPILPESLWDIVESPTPVVCGVLSEKAIEDRHIENGIVVNLDTRMVLVEEHDEMKILSGSLQKVWRQFINLANNNKTREYVYSVYLADAYLYVFICCFKNYKEFIVNKQFKKDELVKNAKTKGIKQFLKMFIETSMFHAFTDAAINNPESLATFDKKIKLYGSNGSQTILDKLIDWHP